MKLLRGEIIHLKNGLEILLVPVKTDVTTLGFFVKAGSIYDLKHPGFGVAHLLEHILSSGTGRLSNSEFEEVVDELGGNVNAYTTEEVATYYATVRNDKVEYAFALLLEMLFSREIKEEDFMREKRIIEEELAVLEEETEDRLIDDFRKNIYIVHPLKFPIQGERELFRKVELEMVREFYREYYVTGNMSFVICGSIKESFLRKMEEMLSNIEAHIPPSRYFYDEPEYSAYPRIESGNVNLDHGIVGFKVLDSIHRYSLEAVIQGVASGETSKLYETLKKQEMVNFVEPLTFFPETGPGFIAIYFISPRGKGKDAAQKIIDILREVNIEKGEILKGALSLRRELEEDFLSTEGIYDILGGDFIRAKNPYITIEKIERVDPDQALVSYEKAVEPEERWTFLVYTNERKIFDFLNLPLVQPKYLSVVTLYGYLFEKKVGIRYLALRTLYEFLKERGFLSEIENWGGILEWELERDFAILRLILPGNSEFAVDEEKMEKYILDLIVSDEILEKAKKDVLNEIEEEEEDWLNVALKHVKELLYPGHPYSREPYGTPDAVESLGVENVKEALREFAETPKIFIRDDLLMKSIDGDIPNYSIPPEPEYGEHEIRWKREESLIIYATRGPSILDEDKLKVEVLMNFIGSSSGSGGLLMRRLRRRGLSYYTSGYYLPSLASGDIIMLVAIKEGRIEEAEKELKGVIDELKSRKLSERELKMALENTLLSFRLRKSNRIVYNEFRAKTRLLKIEEDEEDLLKALTEDDILEVASRYFENWVKVRITPYSRRERK